MVNRVKDLLFNGYGVMLLTNTGFNDLRDSTGISFPDRVFYHTYNIIGYDDTKMEYPECVYCYNYLVNGTVVAILAGSAARR